MKEEKSKVKKKPPTKKNENIVEEDDKRVIIFVGVAIVIIIGTIIGLLIGCQKKENTDKNEDPKEDIVVPKEPDEEKEEKLEEEKISIVVKTSTKKTTTKKKSFEVAFYYNDNEDTYIKNVKEGGKVRPFAPSGYRNCKYYKTNDMVNEYNFNSPVTEAINLYMDCDLIEYEVVYDITTTNPTNYSVIDGNIPLEKAVLQDKIFVGWYTDQSFNNKVTSLTPSIIKYANKEDKINIYAKLVDELKVAYHDIDGEIDFIDSVGFSEYKDYEIASGSDNTCSNNEKFLGWTNYSGNKSIKYKSGEKVELQDDKDLYPVCGKAVVVYASEGEIVDEIAYTEEDLENYELPDAEELNLETPTYYVKVETETETSKKVVSDDKVDVGEKEIKLQEVKDKASEGYIPEIDDDVEELEKEFDGWTHEILAPTAEDPSATKDEKVPDTWIPPENETSELDAKWEEQENPIPPAPGPIPGANHVEEPPVEVEEPINEEIITEEII